MTEEQSLLFSPSFCVHAARPSSWQASAFIFWGKIESMKIGLVGYQGSGKSSLFEWLTGIKADPALAHVSQSAMAAVPEARVEPLCGIYHPKKITLASLELVDTAGLSRSHEGNAARLSLIREAGA